MEGLEKLGRLSLIDLSDQEMEVFVKYLSRSKSTSDFDFLHRIVGSDDFIRLLDVFSGDTVKIPEREVLAKLISYIQIYVYVRNHLKEDLPADKLPDDVVESAAKNFDRRCNSVRRIYEKVRCVLLRSRSDL
jgi:hypothetical protein